MTQENFFAKLVTKCDLERIRSRKEKQSRKGQAELTAQTNKILTKSKETDKNGRGKNLEGRKIERRAT